MSECRKLSMQALFGFLVSRNSLGLSGKIEKQKKQKKSSLSLPKLNYALHKHPRTCTNYLKLYSIQACIHNLVTLNNRLNPHYI